MQAKREREQFTYEPWRIWEENLSEIRYGARKYVLAGFREHSTELQVTRET